MNSFSSKVKFLVSRVHSQSQYGLSKFDVSVVVEMEMLRGVPVAITTRELEYVLVVSVDTEIDDEVFDVVISKEPIDVSVDGSINVPVPENMDAVSETLETVEVSEEVSVHYCGRRICRNTSSR